MTGPAHKSTPGIMREFFELTEKSAMICKKRRNRSGQFDLTSFQYQPLNITD